MGKFFSACNTSHPASLPVVDKKRAQHVAINVDFADGDVARRSGLTLVSDTDAMHSLHASLTTLYYVLASNLYRATAISPTFTPSSSLYVLANDTAVSYARFNGTTYASNGTDAVTLNEGTHAVASWVVARPAKPTLAYVAGSLAAGEYRVAIQQRGANGRSPVSEEATITGGALSGIRLTLPALASGMTTTDIFISEANGGVLYLQTSSATTPVDVTSVVRTGREAPSYKLACMPAGTSLSWFKGRLLSAKAKVLTFSEAFYPTMTDSIKGWVAFSDDITAVVPVETGVWVGTTAAQYYLPGLDPHKWSTQTAKDKGVVLGSAFYNSETKMYGWYDVDGVMLLGAEGKSIQAPVFAPRIATSATSFFDRRTENVVVMLHGTETTSKLEHSEYERMKVLV